MADSEGEAIRRLIKTPDPIPFPVREGDRAAIAPASQIARWYENAGGLDKAVGQAQLAQAERLLSGEGEFPFGTWKVDSLKRPVGTSFTDTGNQGQYLPATKLRPGAIEISDKFLRNPASMQAVLEHELGHAMYMYGNESMSDKPLQGGKKKLHLTETMRAYHRQPTDIDTRLAGIKRRYAFNTGELPQTPGDSEKALKWFIDNWQEPKGPDDANSNDYNAARVLMDMPADEKKKVLQRMLEVVDSHPTDSLIARLGGSA